MPAVARSGNCGRFLIFACPSVPACREIDGSAHSLQLRLAASRKRTLQLDRPAILIGFNFDKRRMNPFAFPPSHVVPLPIRPMGFTCRPTSTPSIRGGSEMGGIRGSSEGDNHDLPRLHRIEKDQYVHRNLIAKFRAFEALPSPKWKEVENGTSRQSQRRP